MLALLARRTSLYVSFAATVALSIGFVLVMNHWDFQLIDEMSDPDKIREHLAGMSETQKRVHIWTTGTLDVLYPFAYGGLFAGLALRFFGRYGPYLALPGILVIPVDLAEGLVQIFLLNGNESLITLKAYLTPLKLALFFLALCIAVVALGRAVYRRFMPGGDQ